MGPFAANQRLALAALFIAAVLAVCGWQAQEHARFERAAAQALINRGRDITSTLGVVVRSQRRFGGIVSKDRLEATLQDLVRPGELEAIAILGATGETIASAGLHLEPTKETLHAPGVVWRDSTLTLMNVMDLGTATTEDSPRPPAAIVVNDPRAFRPGTNRRIPEGAVPHTGEPAAPPATPRSPFGRPAWMSREEYDAVIQKQGVHSLVISLSTAEMRAAVRNDLLLRTLVSLLAAGAALGAALAWRNLRKNAELQIRLVKAVEMNTHLSGMNFAAAGLAHETRNPLNLIRGLAHMITMEPQTSPKLKEHATTIIEEADRVTVQLNEFIHYSKPREAHLAPVDLSALVADVARTLQPDLEEKQVRLACGTAALKVEADAALLRQALFNLLLNAVQAVDIGGSIAVNWTATATGEAALEIADDGPGVPEGDRANIFKPYVTMRPKGAGLGLAIVQQIVSAHRWEITCTENTPRGAVFRVSHLKITAGGAGAT
ncbi:MAG: ATP-binding protein [Opitutaceae bacterium]|nr:ATP-binding protein [Opitutaceae bacterium]